MKILVTGGAGFIGSALVRYLINSTQDDVIVIDKLTYAGNLENLIMVSKNERFKFENIDICNTDELIRILEKYQPDSIMHLAAESHVDRSIDDPCDFIQTNVVGTYNLLNCANKYYKNLSEEKKLIFRFHHISTDEVYGDLLSKESYFTEKTPYAPSSPYSASKASSDHLVRAWNRTYNLPVLITNCSNNYGPYHFPEKLIPNTIISALTGKKISVYGDGKQIRDWLFVDDHVKALYKVLLNGKDGETYNIGGFNEKENITVVEIICSILDSKVKIKPYGINSFAELIEFVKDRPGHDKRYAIDASKIKTELDWHPEETFESGIEKTVLWYLENKNWWTSILDGSYSNKKSFE